MTLWWLFWLILISYWEFLMPRSLKWSILGDQTILLSKNIHKVTKTLCVVRIFMNQTLVSHNLHLNTFHKLYQTQWKIYKSASSNFYGSWLSFPGHEQSRKFVLGTPKILSPAQLLKGFLPRCRTCRCRHCSYNTGRSSKVDTLVDFYQKMD